MKNVQFKAGNEQLEGLIVSDNISHRPDVLFLHGAGESNKERALPIALKLLEHGFASFLFDFSGHGSSSGILKESSLRKRTIEAEAALQFLDQSKPISICAFSMGAHIALELLKTHRHIHTLVLFYPAIYSDTAVSLPFNEQFSVVIRQQNSWSGSSLFEELTHFTGSFLTVIGDDDKVIPKELIELLEQNATNASKKDVIVIAGAPHLLLPSVYNDLKLMESIVAKMIEFLK